MPSSVIGSLRVALGIDSASFETGAKKVEARSGALATNVRNSMLAASVGVDKLKSAFTNLGGLLSTTAIVALAARGLDYASSLGEVSQQLGVTTTDLQQYRYVASQVGVSQEEMDKGLAKLTLTMGQARAGVAGPKAAFAELGKIIGVDVLKSAATAGDAIPLLADAFVKIKDPTQQARLAVELFGKTGLQFLPLLANGASGVNSLRKAVEDLGGVLTEEQIRNADNAADKFSEVKQVLEANIAGTVANNAGAILQLADALLQAGVAATRFFSALGNSNNLDILNNPSLTRISSRLLGNDPNKTIGDARSALLSNKEGRQALFERNRKQRADLRAGYTDSLGYDGQGIPDNPASRAKERARLLEERKQIVQRQRDARHAVAAPVAPSRGAGAGTSDTDAKSARDKAAADAKRRAAEAARAAKEERETEKRYRQELGQTADESLRAQGDLTVELYDRVQVERDLLANEKKARLEAIDADEHYTAQQKAALKKALGPVFDQRAQLIERRAAEDQARADLDLARARNANQEDLLRAGLGLVRTSKERGLIEQKLLDLQFKQLRAEQQAILASPTATDQQKQAATDTLDTAKRLEPLAKAKAARDNQGPLAAYLDSIPKSAGEVNEALQGVAVDGLKSLNDGIADAITNAHSLADAFDNVADQIISALLKIAVQKAIIGPLGTALGGLFGGSASAGDLGQGSGDFLGLGSILNKSVAGARAKGGPVVGGRNYLVGELGEEIFRAPSSGSIIANDDIGSGARTINAKIEQRFAFEGIAITQEQFARGLSATQQSTMAAIADLNRRRP